MLFSLPFIGMGLFFAGMSAKNLDNPNFKNPWIGIIFGLVFAGFGALIFAAGLQSGRTQKRVNAIRAANPDSPWLWREDWAQSRANGASRYSALGLWFFALVWNAISWGAAFAVTKNPQPNKWAYIVVGLFPAVGIFLLVTAIVQTLRQLRFGRTFLQMQSLPAPLGGKLRGTIDVRLPYPLPHGINLSLTCLNRVTSGSGKDRSTSDHIRWKDTTNLGSEYIMAGPTGSAIPVEFEIPRNMPATDHTTSANEILWLLRAEADVPGVNFDDNYEVPVFETRGSPSLADWQTHEEEEQRIHPPTAPVRGTVVVSAAPEGGTQFYFPAGRNVSSAIGVTLFAIFFGGAEVLIFVMHAPFLFPIVFGLMDLLLWFIAVNLWFGTARIVVKSDAVEVHTNLLGYHSDKRWLAGEIKAIYPKITMQSGGGSSGIPYYTITIQALNDREYPMGNALRDHNEAEWLCCQIRDIAKLKARTVSA